MIFKLKTSGSFYPDSKDRERLRGLGFSFEIYTANHRGAKPKWMMKNIDYDEYLPEPEIEINSLEELLKFIEEHGEIILNQERIEIYDNYRE